MELKLIYRALRKISDWTIAGFYSEVYIEGQENITQDRPLIIVSTHHNEIIDIATLAATIPYRRHVSFWAKSSMFINPITRSILLSSGAIPVKRNPNNANSGTTRTTPSSSNGSGVLQANLFRESSHALAAGEVIGVFPEGTSYTQPSIVQIMPGAAWAAIDYIRWKRLKDSDAGPRNGKELTIVPVAIVYTDKSRYLSRIYVKYGKPIVISSYTNDIFIDGADVEKTSRIAVKRIMEEVEKQMTRMTINAPDWDTLYTMQMARDILWEDTTNIQLKHWVTISQTLVEVFTAPASASLGENTYLASAKASLTKYYALLHYTQIEHSTLNTLLPTNDFSGTVHLVGLLRVLAHLPVALFSFFLFAPPMLLHIPGYITGGLAGKLFAAQGEEEAQAQFKTIFGGLGIGLGAGLASRVLTRLGWLNWMWNAIDVKEGGVAPVKRILSVLGIAYGSVYLLVKWHNLLVYSNYKRLKTLITLYKLCVGLASNTSITRGELEVYIRPPPPPPNPFIKKKDIDSEIEDMHKSPTVNRLPSRKLIRPLLIARSEAYLALGAYLKSINDSDVIALLRSKGAKMP